MRTFEQAVTEWTDDINEWYRLGTGECEVKIAFQMLKESQDELSGDADEYVKTFFRESDGGWSDWLDTADRERLAHLIEVHRQQQACV